jgi:hypothetical protein
VKAGTLYTSSCIIAVALLGAIAWAFLDEPARQAMMLSAGIAVAVQVVAFTMARLLLRKNVMLGWGLGSVLRLVVLVLFAVVSARTARATMTPALLSFVGFLFVTTVIEPIFLKQ